MTFITLLTDFETRDGFAAAMKGVILSIASEARVIDAGPPIDEPLRLAKAGVSRLRVGMSVQ